MFTIKDFSIGRNIDDHTFRNAVYQKRIKLIDIAINWSGETTENEFIFHNIWKYPNNASYQVSLGKYGKEYYQSGSTGNNQKNCNDMKPTVLFNNTSVPTVRGRFDDIFRLMESCGHDTDLLKAFAVLFFRNALLLDHNITNGNYSYEPPKKLIDYICRKKNEFESIPMEVYIHFLDAIGLNEDVKYYTQGKLLLNKGIGRENNMKTYVHDICCLLGFTKWYDFIYSLMRGYGVAPISNKNMADFFPELAIEYKEPRPRASRERTENLIIKDIINEY